jgi:hypothetical protein
MPQTVRWKAARNADELLQAEADLCIAGLPEGRPDAEGD